MDSSGGDGDFLENLSFCQIFYKAFLVYKTLGFILYYSYNQTTSET